MDVQAGRQLEWLTGGHVKAGFHEVLHTPEAVAAAEAARLAGRSTWRVSSTLFAHVASDQLLRPLGRFAHHDDAGDYPPTPAGEYVESELSVIKLRRSSASAGPTTSL
jgi:HAMP domain-containing protein